MITQEILLVDNTDNGDGTISLIAELCVYKNGIFSHHDSRSLFTFQNTMTNQDIIDYLWSNEYLKYKIN